ncbi:MAG: exodeoxyribonuclease VII large subunit [Chloroflexi bacterium]|nr:MAG: exodeoxyribonuclease VII large subunit [Chloroflexota bacterium]
MFEQLSLFGGSTFSEPYTVSQLTGYIRRLIEDDPELSDVWVEGEVSNFSRASSGHCYFTLKDAGSQIGCVMWRSVAKVQDYLPVGGDLVLAHGRVGVYEAGGRYQLYVDQLRPAGVGDLYRQFELLKARLEAEGLFAPERKRPLPRFPRRIGVVTSPSAAALRDILNVLGRRYPLAEVLLAPTPVQGDDAPPQIVAAIEALNGRDDVDIIIVARGGGSLEELWAFNDERVARAVAASRIPVICGVGHETDFSLADFAADVRAPTPSAAAELVAPDRAELRAQVAGLAAALVTALQGVVEERRWRLAEQTRALKHLSPAVQLAQARQRVDDLLGRAEAAVRHSLTLRRERLGGLTGRLAGVSPLGTLERGYAIVCHRETGAVVRSVAQVASGDALDVRVADGEFEATASQKRPGLGLERRKP